MSSVEGRPLRVLAIDHTAPVRTVRDRYLRLTRQASVELTLLAPPAWPENAAWTPFQPNPEETHETILGRVSWPGHEVKAVYLSGIVKAFRRSRPEVIFMMEEAFSLFALQAWMLKLIFAPKARMVFYACWIIPYHKMFYRPVFLFKALNRFMLRRLDAGLCINGRATEALEEAGYDRARTLFFGVDERIFTPMPRREARERLGIPQEIDMFLYAGRLLELKGVQDLIEAFAGLHAERPEHPMRLVILGQGEFAGELRNRAESLGIAADVEFHDSVPNQQVRVYMSAATAFVLPSRAEWHEQFGRVNAEAMLTGTTVIGSTSGEIPSVIGEGGFLFRANDPDDLKRALAEVLDSPQEVERRKRVGRQKAIRDYSVAAFVDGVITVLEQLSGRRLRTEAT